MKKFLPVFLLVLFLVPLVASAADLEFSVCSLLQIAKQIVAAIGLAIAVILLIVSGIKYMTAGGDAEKATTARKGIVNAIIGIIIVIGALFIIALAQSLLLGAGATSIEIIGNTCAGYIVP